MLESRSSVLSRDQAITWLEQAYEEHNQWMVLANSYPGLDRLRSDFQARLRRYPRANRGANLVFTNAAIGLAGRIAGNILREFSKRVTTHAPDDRKL
ncbi:MAG: hypothetical protein WCA91_01640 [Candidatus Acidiferrales bacterium]